MYTAHFFEHILRFKEAATTSRATMTTKRTFVVLLFNPEVSPNPGIGECALFEGLSAEDTPDYLRLLNEACRTFNGDLEGLPPVSSIRFGFETALASLSGVNTFRYSDTAFTRGEQNLKINGLIWMGDHRTMERRIREKINAGFRCIKLKIGGIDFDDELDLLRHIRCNFSAADMELRLDANGSFRPEDALQKLEQLAQFDIHSIEQPLKAGQVEQTAMLCRKSPIPIALDEELIGFSTPEHKRWLLDTIKPQYIILKPSLCGGFHEADGWIAEACQRGIGWWATSALESHIGLNAIAQWVAPYEPLLPQGLGTGHLYHNDFPSPIIQEHDYVRFDIENY